MTPPNGGAFVDDSADKIDIPAGLGGGWVEIKPEMTIEDWERFEAEQFSIDVTGANVPRNRRERRLQLRATASATDAPPPTQTGHFNPSLITLLERNIIRWSWDRPLTRENISKLRRPVADLLVAAVEERNIPLLPTE